MQDVASSSHILHRCGRVSDAGFTDVTSLLTTKLNLL
jgi:hypothetical protein